VEGRSRAARRRQRRARNSTTVTVSEVEEGRSPCVGMTSVLVSTMTDVPVIAPHGVMGVVVMQHGQCITGIHAAENHTSDFGNPLLIAEDAEKCRDLIAKFEQGNREQICELAQWLAPVVRRFSFSREGCRVVQKAIETAGGRDRDQLVKNLEPYVLELLESPHGNHVVAKMVEIMPPSAIGFVIEAIRRNTAPIARHRFGCRILERLVEHCSEQQMSAVLDEVVSQAEPLCRHPYGNFVVQHLLEHGSHSRRAGILQKLLQTLPQLAVHRTASHVIQKAIDYSDEDGKRLLVTRLLHEEGPYSIVVVACSRYGSFVVEQLASVNVGKEEVRQSLECSVNELHESQFGKKVIDCFGLVCGTLPSVSIGTVIAAAGTTPPIGGA